MNRRQKKKNWKKKMLPDLEGVELRECDPRIFDPGETPARRDYYGFVLALAVAFNDLKGLNWWLHQLNKGKPDPWAPVSAYLGEVNGLISHVQKLTFGIFVELLVLIQEQRELIASPDFQALIGRTTAKAQESWHDLVGVAGGTVRVGDEFRSLAGQFQRIRAAGIYHYKDMRGILRGYETFFASEPTKFNRTAYFSAGNALERSRFYFADAAVQGYSVRVTEEAQVPLNIVNTFVERFVPRMNRALRLIVEEFIKTREAELQR
jgi:hypothetical protein